MFKKIKNYFLENLDTIVANLALANGADFRPYLQ